MANISESHLYRYISGASEPTASRLVALADAAGVSVDWLATGRGTAHGAREERIDYADLDILEDVIEKTRRRFQDLGVKLSPDREARAIRLVFEFCLRHGESMDDASLAGIIELAALR
jgi:transcriptional regulator with XRE-family HTH domain